jgi:hypothetical protein
MSVILFIPLCINRDINTREPYDHKEKFDPSLSWMNTIDKLEWYTDSIAINHRIDPESPDYYVLLEQVISNRFYHGFSHYALKENFIAAGTEKITGVGVSCRVTASSIMQKEYAACSQQAIVMMAIARKKEMPYRKVGFPHHYALEIEVDGNWYYFDPNMEPEITLSERLHQNWQEQNDSLKKYYASSRHANLDYQFGHGQRAELGIINEVPAQNARLFQFITQLLSRIAWLIPLALIFVRRPAFRKFRLFPAQEPHFHPAFHG